VLNQRALPPKAKALFDDLGRDERHPEAPGPLPEALEVTMTVPTRVATGGGGVLLQRAGSGGSGGRRSTTRAAAAGRRAVRASSSSSTWS